MILFLDSETSGLPRKGVPMTDPSQPWVVSLTADLRHYDGSECMFMDVIIRADGREMSPKAQAIHGISAHDSRRLGVPETHAFALLGSLCDNAEQIVGYNLGFDTSVIAGTMERAAIAYEAKNGKPNKALQLLPSKLFAPGLQHVDVVRVCTPICNLPNKSKDSDEPKWPNLDEACQIILGMEPRGDKHVARDDVDRVRKLYFELVKRGAIEAPPTVV